MTRRKHDEDDLHKAVADFLGIEKNLALPEDAVWTTVEHGGTRGKREAGRLKAKGLRPGWPDIQIVWRGRAYFVELKAFGKYLSPAQKKTHGALLKAGVPVATCRRIEEVEGTLRGWGIPLKATTGARTA